MRFFFAFLTVLIGSGLARAEEAISSPVFTLHTADGRTQTGRLIEIDTQWGVRLGGARTSRVTGTEIVSLERSGVVAPPFLDTDSEQLILATGGRLAGRLVGIAEDQLRFRPSFGDGNISRTEVKLPLSAVAAVWLAAPRGKSPPSLWLRELLREERASDVLWLSNGDRLEGSLLDLTGEGFRIKAEGGRVTVLPRSRVAVAALNTELVSRARPKGIHGLLVLANGSRLLVTSVTFAEEGQVVQARLVASAVVNVPVDQIVSLDYRNGCATHLSELKPSRYEHTPFFGPRWPYTVDLSVSGGDLRVGGGTYDKGLGMHSRSRLSYNLAGSWGRFEALVGLDERMARHGRARIQVLIDDKPAVLLDGSDSVDLSARRGPMEIRADVAGKQKLTLVVDFGPQGDVQGHVSWVNARLIRPSSKR
jgi:hypothetical protein